LFGFHSWSLPGPGDIFLFFKSEMLFFFLLLLLLQNGLPNLPAESTDEQESVRLDEIGHCFL
jgi:hypothetical protein